MQYSLRIKASAAKELAAIDGIARRQKIVDAIESLAQTPRPEGCKKLAGWEGALRIRIGDYRIVYTVSDSEIIVEIIKIGHRREIYRRD